MKILRVIDETDDREIKSFDLIPVDAAAAPFRFVPGQFCELSIVGEGEAPFGIASAPVEEGFVRFTVKRVGRVTSRLHSLAPDAVIGMRGPLGNGFPLDAFEGHDIVVIGGGFAFTTLRSLLIEMMQEGQRERYGKLTVVYGVREPGLFLYREDLAIWQARDDVEVLLTIDAPVPGWDGQVGFVPQAVQELAPSADNSVAVICGPPIMIRFTLPVLLGLGFRREAIYTSLENRMQCGVGKGGRCNVGHKYVCIDGPVFSMAELDELPPEY
ncbi:MAG: FAD/NAD(P)-binding protein [Anaerolineae bacterium]|nr:FAD/NAD(P)-binding protein [Anaerolineae bacterium]